MKNEILYNLGLSNKKYARVIKVYLHHRNIILIENIFATIFISFNNIKVFKKNNNIYFQKAFLFL